ncbi:MAG TPA: hypothetical protein VFP20_07675 [Bacteroidales bacterium]|nr:hypothetical protein [Bacteroidales bacterium]
MTHKIGCFVLLLICLTFYSPKGYASVEVVGALKQVFSTNPGETVKGQIQIQNSDDKDQEVRIYQTDYLFNFKDQTYYENAGSTKRSNANWISYSPKTVVLKGKDKKTIDFEIKAPTGDSIKGTYWSIIMVEGVEPINPQKSGDLNIRTATRYAVQVVNEINSKSEGLLKFNEPTLIKGSDDKSLFLAVDIVNEGEHYISPEVSIELYDEAGILVKKITAPRRGLYPSTSARYKLSLEGVPSKKTYTAMIVAAGSENDVFGLEYTLYF